MDLTPFYELRDRLHTGAIAGAALAAEDFRLARALEGMAPLERVAPVFQRLGQLTRALIAPDCPDRAGTLLDALSLADAVACTQGAVAVLGTVEPLPLTARGRAVSNAPYSLLSPLLEALTTSGGGKYSFVVETHGERPELFEDYRVTEALVLALGAAYPELADKAEEWLSREDESILPLLRRDFDPRGKKDMVRRVRVMEAVAGSGANDFYLAQLEEAEKEVRSALIYALRHDGANAEKLVELCRTEKGGCKKMAHWALAKLEGPAARDYWAGLAAKKPEQAAQYMVLAATEQASALTAEAIGRWLEPWEADSDRPVDPKELERLHALFFALPGKAGPAVCDCYRRMAALGTALDNKSCQGANGQSMAVRFNRLTPLCTARDYLPFSGAVAQVLRQSILFRPAPDLLALAGELEGTAQTSFAVPALTAALLSRPAGEAFALAEPFLKPAGLLLRKQRQGSRALLKAALDGLYWDEEGKCLSYFLSCADPAGGQTVHLARPLRERPDRRWYDALMALGAEEGVDGLLERLLCPDDPALRARLGRYFYKRALIADDNRPYFSRLCRCGWTECQGLLEAYCRRHRVNTWEVCALLPQLPGGPAEVAAEARRVLELVQGKKIAVGTWNPTAIERWLQDPDNMRPIRLKLGGYT